jgi:hypothetical protein
LHFAWVEEKTSTQHEMIFVSDSESYKTCPFHGLAAAIISGDSNASQQPHEKQDLKSVFPIIASKNDGGTARWVNGVVNYCISTGKVRGLNKKETGTGFRVGAGKTLALSEGKNTFIWFTFCIIQMKTLSYLKLCKKLLSFIIDGILAEAIVRSGHSFKNDCVIYNAMSTDPTVRCKVFGRMEKST